MPRVVRFAGAIAVCLGLALAFHVVPRIGAQAPIPHAGPAPYSFPPGSARLYRISANGSALRPLNGRSLADMQAPLLPTGLHPVPNFVPNIVTSPDGSRFVTLEDMHPRRQPAVGSDLMIRLYSAFNGALLSAHHPAIPISMTGISANGAVVYGLRDDVDFNQPCGSTQLYLVNSRTGRVEQHLTIGAKPWDALLMGPNLQRLYTMTVPDHINSCAPDTAYSPTLTAYDVRTGRAVRAIQLKSVLAGQWNTSRTLNGEPIGENWQPAIALSPDGSQLAIFDGHNDRLVLLDARTLGLEGTERLSTPRSALQSVAALLGLTPDTADAKGEIDGAIMQMQYTPDGRSLLVWGARLHPDKKRLYSSSQSLGFRLVNVRTGQVRARYDDKKRIDSVWVAPDGSAVYSAVQGWDGGWLSTIRRHNAATLQVTARRTFSMTSWQNLLFLRAPSS